MSKKLFRKLINRFTPNHKVIKDNRHLRLLGKWLDSPNLWHLNRYSVSTAFSVGLFSALMPIPFQMLLSAILAICFKANIPISVILVWLTNPITFPPILYFCYRLGNRILNLPSRQFNFELSLDWLSHEFHAIGTPMLLGCFVCGTFLALFGNIAVRVFWRLMVIYAWRKRASARK